MTTGIGRLREFARSVGDLSVWTGGERLMDIADQIERESVPPTDPSLPRGGDRKPLAPGDRVWGIDNGCPWVVTGHAEDGVYVAWEDVSCDKLDAESLTHERVRVGADMEPVRFGETVWSVKTDGEAKVFGFSGDYALVVWDGLTFGKVPAEELTHSRPEPPDSRESVEEDASKGECQYFGHDGLPLCIGCPGGNARECTKRMKKDLVRRCHELAERGDR